MKKNGTAGEEAPVVRAARDLATALDEIETLTSRSAKVELSSRAELERGAELLQEAEAKHREFLAHLAALAGAVEDLRARQNASAATLSQHDEQLAARRLECEPLERRFTQLAEGAREMTAALAVDDPSTLQDVRERLAAAADEARALTTDARETGLRDLERDAHALAQQLGALARKLDRALSN